jgi:hypothetical protein
MMSQDSRAMIFVVMGILLTMLGVGGVENSVTDTELVQSLAVSGLGLLFMWIGTLIIRQAGYR